MRTGRCFQSRPACTASRQPTLRFTWDTRPTSTRPIKTARTNSHGTTTSTQDSFYRPHCVSPRRGVSASTPWWPTSTLPSRMWLRTTTTTVRVPTRTASSTPTGAVGLQKLTARCARKQATGSIPTPSSRSSSSSNLTRITGLPCPPRDTLRRNLDGTVSEILGMGLADSFLSNFHPSETGHETIAAAGSARQFDSHAS